MAPRSKVGTSRRKSSTSVDGKGTVQGQELPADQPPGQSPTPPRRRICLRDIDAVRREMCRLYRDARRGHLLTNEAAKLTYILGEIRRTFELSVIERRLSALEDEHEHS